MFLFIVKLYSLRKQAVKSQCFHNRESELRQTIPKVLFLCCSSEKSNCDLLRKKVANRLYACFSNQESKDVSHLGQSKVDFQMKKSEMGRVPPYKESGFGLLEQISTSIY
eukprot:TRINITY_DN39653_c0_g1_i1.p2 TRINITY_DN39653_c0_g1~~TRINITY_DN39653_c0_g1_i1.p2  ORF type:complete len:110 (+),score=1.43 TRINITY_DN39653_c0_g1_i1:78-407(+)